MGSSLPKDPFSLLSRVHELFTFDPKEADNGSFQTKDKLIVIDLSSWEGFLGFQIKTQWFRSSQLPEFLDMALEQGFQTPFSTV